MVTNDERREVAARLRNFKQLRGVFHKSNVCAFSDVLGVGYMDWERICARLADLIDRPSCRDIGNSYHMFVCSECGCELDVDDREGEPTMWNGGAASVPSYCPNCGAAVVEKENSHVRDV